MMLWITPVRALTNDIKKAMQEVCERPGHPLANYDPYRRYIRCAKKPPLKKTARSTAYHPRKPAPDAGPKRISQTISKGQ
jgi:hypothetical protein